MSEELQHSDTDLSAKPDSAKKVNDALKHENIKSEVGRTAKSVSKKKIMARGAFLTALICILLMAILFAASALLTFEGSFTIRVFNPSEGGKVISLSETAGFSNPTVRLSGVPINNMDNITFDWLPLEELDAHDGNHNGEDYIDYTFYIKNSGDEELEYLAEINITKCTLNIDEAVRVMVFRNGEPTIYAKPAQNGKTEKYPEKITDFVTSRKVMSNDIKDFGPGDIDRWTVVAWLEGEDPECVNEVLGGTLKMEMNFTVIED